MPSLPRTSLFLLATLLAPSVAQAHFGHIGEMGGHSHWLGYGALVVAAAAIALLPKKKRETDKTEETAEDETSAEGEAGEAA